MTAKFETPYRLSGALILIELARQIVPKTGMGDEGKHTLLQTFSKYNEAVILAGEHEHALSRQHQTEMDDIVEASLDFLNSHEELLSSDDLETIAVAKGRYTGTSIVEDAAIF